MCLRLWVSPKKVYGTVFNVKHIRTQCFERTNNVAEPFSILGRRFYDSFALWLSLGVPKTLCNRHCHSRMGHDAIMSCHLSAVSSEKRLRNLPPCRVRTCLIVLRPPLGDSDVQLLDHPAVP